MSEQIEIGDPPIAITLKRSKRARRISLRVSATGTGVSLTIPQRANRSAALEFARNHEDWLRRHLAKRPEHVVPAPGVQVPIDGQFFQIALGQGRRIVARDGQLEIPGNAEQIPAKLRAYLKTLARDRLAAASEYYARQIDRSFGRITLRDTRSRWGSCTSDGNLMYSWRLVMAPRRVQDYVAAHEVCHLVHMDHSAAYWAQVSAIFPDFEAQRKWLMDHGAELHRYRF